MSLSLSRDQQGGSAVPAEDPPPSHLNFPEHSSFTSFPEGEGSTNPDIPPEPMLNKLYNKVLSLAGSGKSPTPSVIIEQQSQSPHLVDAKSKVQETTSRPGISLGSSHQSKSPSITSFGGIDTNSVIASNPPPLPEKVESNSNHQSIIKPLEKSPDVLEPVVSTVNAVGGVTRSEDEFSVIGSDKAPADSAKQTTKSHLREISLPGLAGFRLTREPSSDSESISSYSAHPGRTVKSIIGRLKTGDLGREFWMKDETSHECFRCGEKFTTFRRKHHCRICGRIFDDKCTSHIPGSRFGHQEKIRVCNSCKSIMDEYDDIEAQGNNESIQHATVSLNLVPPQEHQLDGIHSSGGDSPQTAYTIPTARRPGTVPRMAIPATRTAIGTSGRHTAVEIPMIDGPSSRPQSSRSNNGIQIGRRRSTSFSTQLSTRPRSNSIPIDEAYSRAPFHQNNMNDDEMLSHDVPGETEDQFYDVSGEESYAPISASREGFLDSPTLDSSPQDHLKPPAAIQRHRSTTKSSFEERLRTTKRRSIQSIHRRSRSKSRGHRGSSSIAGDHFTGNDLVPPSPTASLSYPQSISSSSPVNVVADLNQTSILHVQKLLTQMLVEEEIENADTWQRALMPILLKIADTLDPDVRGMGDDIDVRSYVKIKRLPGGAASDSTYVSGVVFTKNLALKRMPRTISNPRIMLVTFPVEYHHSEMQLMSLDPMIAQGKEYIHNLVMRIVSHKPSVVVIGNTVSGIALDYLLRYGISTLYNVKPSVIEALSRCCEADIISSIDKLSSNPQLGSCAQFSVRTSVHNLIPGHKKTLVYLNGCPAELGCTVVLRGADMQTLSRIKRVLDFMIYAAYNLKLETSLMYDNLINIPSLTELSDDSTETSIQPMDEVQNSDSTVYDNEIREFKKIILSASPYVKFPPPELLTKARDAEISANRLRQEHENARAEEQQRAAKLEAQKETNRSSEQSDPDKVPPDPEKPLSELPDQATPLAEFSQESYQRRVDNLLHEYRHNRAIRELALRHKQWENFKQLSPEIMNPLAHQNIIVLYSNLQKKTSVPCQGPDIHIIDFYSETDCTLGQYVEDLFLHKEVHCEECEKFQYEHVRNYVHNQGRMNVFIEKHPCPLPGMQQSILMWSWCSVCEITLNVSRMSENSYRYSFGKWLELAFYAKDLKHRGGLCPHDINYHHVRYFGYDNWAVRFQYDAVDVLSLVVPEMRLTWEPEVDVRLKADEKVSIAGKVNRFFNSVSDRLKTINMENIASEKQEACKSEIAQLIKQAQTQRESSLNALERIWYESMVLDRLPLNRVLKDLQDHVVHWDSQFGEFEKNFLPSDKDIRRLTAIQLRKLVGDSGLPFMDVLERKASGPNLDSQPTEGKATPPETLTVSEKGKDLEVLQPPPSEPYPTQEPSEAIDVPLNQRGEETSPSILPSSIDSRVSEISEVDSERRMGNAPKILSVAPKIARLQAEIISPSTSPRRKPMGPPIVPGLTRTISPPHTRSRNLSAQSSESEDTPPFSDLRKEGRNTPRSNVLASKIPKAKPPQPLTSIHAKSKSGDNTSEFSHKRRNSSDENPDRPSRGKPHKQFMSNTIKKLQRVAGTSQSVSSLAKHFDELSRQYEKEEIRRRKRFGYRRAFPVTSAKPKVEVFSNVQDAVLEASDDELGTEMDSLSVGHSRKSTMKGPEDVPTEAIRDQQGSENASLQSAESEIHNFDRPTEANTPDIAASPAAVLGKVIADIEETQDLSGIVPSEEVVPGPIQPEDTKESVSIMKAITNLWADRSAALWKPLQYPLQPSAHIFSDSDVIVREDEPSSLIAFTLSSQDYELKLNGLKAAEQPLSPSVARNTPNLSHPPSRDGAPDQYLDSLPSTNDIEAALLKSTGTHLKYQFQEGSANFFCKIFYAEQFDALRINCGCDEHYIQSLSRCLKWDSSGGKSKSAFLKTLDNRLVVKQMSRYEMDAFVKFAPAYFEYMSQAFFHELPTVLAKILGFYQIGSKNPVTGRTMKMDVLVMENLFYNRKTTRIFDLKGSMRNRHVQSTGKANEVLLDENLVEFIYESPLFVGQHSKRVLRHSLWNDTLFLAKMNVMDYSLVIGIDEEHRDLILGIIDFIRTFTWDKKLESWVKERGFVGGGTKEPTIVTPRQYKNRFRASMERMPFSDVAAVMWNTYNKEAVKAMIPKNRSPKTMASREATHAGSWYSSRKSELASQLKRWLDAVPEQYTSVSGARVIIAPHAGYSYSGETAAYAYNSLDLTGIKRVFLLGPSHHVHLTNAALSQCTTYKTPLGNLSIDTDMIKELKSKDNFGTMTISQDEDEHSLEMHLPYIYTILAKNMNPMPSLVPIMVGATNADREKQYGRLFAPYIANKENLFIISSDFCHWGSRFQYTYYNKQNRRLTPSTSRTVYSSPPIYKAIETLDRDGMTLIADGDYDAFAAYLWDTGNTICGRHPIGVIMCALTELKSKGVNGKWEFIKYEQSSHVESISDSSVSYVSAYWAPTE